MKPGKLRIGILLDTYAIPAWIYRSMERIHDSDYAEFSLIVLNEDGKVRNKNDRRLHEKSPNVYRLFNMLDESIFIRGNNALESKNSQELLLGVPVMVVKPARRGLEDYFEARDIEEINKCELDVVINIGFESLQGDILTVAKYGVWAYQFEGSPHGFWEVIESHPETKEYLLILNEKPANHKIIYGSASNTYLFSPARNRNRSLWKSSSFLPRQLALLNHLGEQNFLDETKKYRQNTRPQIQKKYERPPANLSSVSLYARLVIRNIREMFSRLFTMDTWFLMFDLGPYGSIPWKNFTQIIPPKDRFWADPIVIQKDNRLFVFIEEFDSRAKKGHLSFLEVDQYRKHTIPVKILEETYHLSYPFVFEWGDRYYMIPESASNRTIDLYESVEFPHKWEHKMCLMENLCAVDSTLLFYRGKWWLFTGISENEGSFPEVELFLFFTDDLFTRDWKPHPLNPIVSDVKKARPAGRIFSRNGKLFRPSQDCSKTYGFGFDINEILVLSETDYQEESAISVRPDWDKKISATHTYGTVGEFQIIDAYTMRKKFL